MGTNNGVIRIGRKGIRKFAFGEGEPFEVDVVVAFQGWICVDETFREHSDDRSIPSSEMSAYHQAAVSYVTGLATSPGAMELCAMNPENNVQLPNITVAEALDFIARLRECYDEVADFFLPKSRRESESPDLSAAELRFSVEGS